MEIIIKELTEDISYDAIADIVREAYSYWDDLGFDYAARNYTGEDIKRVSQNGTCLIALADGELAGVIIFYLGRKYKDLGTTNSAHSHVLAVSNKYNGHNIGNTLAEYVFDYAKKAGCDEFIADTCAKNKKLLRRYEKMNLKIVSYTSFNNTSYYSAVLLKPLNKEYSKFFFISHRIKGWLKTHLLFNANGSYRPAAKILRKIKGL